MKVEINVPDGVSGDWKIVTDIVEDCPLRKARAMLRGGGRYVPAGKYKRLIRDGVTVMSNTPDECRDFKHFTRIAEGHILINGLGLGVVLTELLKKESVKSIIVIEKSEDVIKLVAPSFKDDKRVQIINADCFEWKAPIGMRFNFVWHDIWDYICYDNLEEMSILHRKYGRRTDWQDSWCKYECKELT